MEFTSEVISGFLISNDLPNLIRIFKSYRESATSFIELLESLPKGLYNIELRIKILGSIQDILVQSGELNNGFGNHIEQIVKNKERLLLKEVVNFKLIIDICTEFVLFLNKECKEFKNWSDCPNQSTNDLIKTMHRKVELIDHTISKLSGLYKTKMGEEEKTNLLNNLLANSQSNSDTIINFTDVITNKLKELKGELERLKKHENK